LQDYVWWSGLTVGDAREGIALVQSDLTQAVVNEKTYWICRPSGTSPGFKSRDAHLLPAYDEYNVAYKDRDAVLDLTNGYSRLTTSDILAPTLLFNGKIGGTWKAAITKNSLTITLAPVKPLKKAEKLAIDKAIGRYAKFLGSPVANYSISAANFRGAVD
jgi:hypothetical protein